MNFLIYALCCFVLPLWVFAGLYLIVEIAGHLKQRYEKK